MAVSLKKGGRVDLTKGTGLKEALIGLGWNINRYQDSADFDLDLVMFECDKAKHCIDEKHMIYFNNIEDPEHAIKHSGDNRIGDGKGDAESATIKFDNISGKVENIIIVVAIYNAKANGQNFGLVDNSYIRMVNTETGEEILRYDLGEDFSTQTSVVFAEVYKNNGEWKFRAVGEGYEKELEALCREYGLEVAN